MQNRATNVLTILTAWAKNGGWRTVGSTYRQHRLLATNLGVLEAAMGRRVKPDVVQRNFRDERHS